MFVATADQNYILARIAYFNLLDTDFFWLSLHAVEKYLKAILLLNRQSAKLRHGHNLLCLHKKVIALHPKLAFGPFVNPRIRYLDWRDVSIEDFIKRLNDFGDPNNRYLVYGYSIALDDLMKVDQLVWSIRRHCRPLRERFELDGDLVEIDKVEVLRRNPERWVVNGSLPIERVIDGKGNAELRSEFLRLNRPFAPNADHDASSTGRFGAMESPLLRDFELLLDPRASSETRAEAAKILQWAMDNINLGEAKKQIEDALSIYKAGL